MGCRAKNKQNITPHDSIISSEGNQTVYTFTFPHKYLPVICFTVTQIS